jgi:hypothetical protein
MASNSYDLADINVGVSGGVGTLVLMLGSVLALVMVFVFMLLMVLLLAVLKYEKGVR